MLRPTFNGYPARPIRKQILIAPATFSIFRLANQPMQISLEGYTNAVKPSVAGEELLGDWTTRTKWQVLFPN